MRAVSKGVLFGGGARVLLLGLAGLALTASGCGRIGYEPMAIVAADSDGGDGGGDEPDGVFPSPSDTRPESSDAPDAGREAGSPPPVEPPVVEPGPDGAPGAETAPAVDGGAIDAPAVDALPIDTAPPDAGAVAVCRPVSAGDLIADFEDGTLAVARVGGRGGPLFHLIDTSLGSVLNVPVGFCGQRAMRVTGAPLQTKSPLVQGHFLTNDADQNPRWYDARAYRGVTMWLRGSGPVSVRIKLPNSDTIAGADPFQATVSVGTTWSQVTLAWGAFKQLGLAGAQQFPTFRLDRLYAIELSASLASGETLLVDNIAFVR